MTAKKSTTGRVTPPKKNLTPTPASQWKTQGATMLTFPSGKVANVRNPGMKAFITAGLIPNSLLPIVTEALDRGQPPSQSALGDVVKKDPKFIAEMLDAVDAVTVYCMVDPQVHQGPVWTVEDCRAERCTAEEIGTEAYSRRDPEEVYVDEVDLQDKMFLFQWAVGGTQSVERFRKEYSTSMAAVQSGQDLGS